MRLHETEAFDRELSREGALQFRLVVLAHTFLRVQNQDRCAKAGGHHDATLNLVILQVAPDLIQQLPLFLEEQLSHCFRGFAGGAFGQVTDVA